MDAKKFDSKIYCCSNSPRSEAKILGIVDIILNLLGLGFAIWVTDMVKNHPEYFRSITENSNSTMADFAFLRNLDKGSQEFFMSASLISAGWGMVLGGVLFYAAQKSRIGLLKCWFIITAFCLFMRLFVGIISIVHSRWKIFSTAVVLMSYLYTGYELWIVFCLVRQLQPVINDSSCQPHGEDNNHELSNCNNPALVVVSPTTTPDPGSVFTISGKGSATKRQGQDEECGEKVPDNDNDKEVTVVQPMAMAEPIRIT